MSTNAKPYRKLNPDELPPGWKLARIDYWTAAVRDEHGRTVVQLDPQPVGVDHLTDAALLGMLWQQLQSLTLTA